MMNGDWSLDKRDLNCFPKYIVDTVMSKLASHCLNNSIRCLLTSGHQHQVFTMGQQHQVTSHHGTAAPGDFSPWDSSTR